jgi:hypothetical protein
MWPTTGVTLAGQVYQAERRFRSPRSPTRARGFPLARTVVTGTSKGAAPRRFISTEVHNAAGGARVKR